MLESILIKNVDIVFPDSIKTGDVFIKDGKIQAFGSSLSAAAEYEINDSGLTLMPGVIDAHVHFREPGLEWKEDLESGTRAAVAGGVTSFFDMPNTNPATIDCESLEQKKKIAQEKSLANYNFFIGATKNNLDEVINAKNIPGVKIFMGSSTGSLLLENYKDMEAFFAKGDFLIAVHAEADFLIKENQNKLGHLNDIRNHRKIRSIEAAIEATEIAISLAKKYKRRLHICHLTSEAEALYLSKEKEGSRITAEVTPQHLFLHSPGAYLNLGTLAQVNPPIRDHRHSKMLFAALKQGVIDLIATDHAPHTLEEKQQEYGKAPSGMPGIETSLPLMLNTVNNGKSSLIELSNWMSTNPAKVFNIHNKGQIKKGFDADLVLVDLNAKKQIQNKNLYTKSGWSAFDGWQTQGWPVATFVNGQMVFREGDFFTETKGKEIIIRD
jgi:dihydroorotase